MNKQLYGISSLAPRQHYLFGGITKKIRNIIPNELGQIASAAAPFVAAANPLAGAALAAFGSFDRTGKLSDVVKSAAINYGLGQASRYIGGAGFQTPDQGIASFGNLFQGNTAGFLTSPIGTETGLQLGQYDFFKSTPTQNTVLNSEVSGAERMYPSSQYADPEFSDLGVNREAGQLYSEDYLKNAPEFKSTTGSGYTDLGKKIISPDTTLADRFSAIKDLGSKALKDIYTTPITDASGKVVDSKLDKTALIATLSGASTYIQAKKKADEAGLTDEEFNEEIYQQNKIAPFKTTFSQRLQPSSFGITTAKDGGRIGFRDGIGPMSNNRISQIIQLIRDAESVGDIEKAEELRLDLYRETKKADGGRIGFESGNLVLPKYKEGPGNKQIRLQMERAAKKAQEEYMQRKIEEQLLDKNYNEQSMYDWKKTQKELFDMAPEEGYPPLPEPKKPEGVLSIKLTEKKAKGGRIGYADGTPAAGLVFNPEPYEGPYSGPYIVGGPRPGQYYSEPGSSLTSLNVPRSDLYKMTTANIMPGTGGSTSGGSGFGGMESLIKQIIKQPYVPTNRPVNDLYQYYLNNENDSDVKNQILDATRSRFNRANGGVMDVAPMRMLKGGIPEMDLRAKGGYVPYGKKERADDVPAMLSKNEFVFTAKAVRNAGNGSINKGAQKMYKLMKSLENKSVRR